jgi:hypothetical protein
MQEVIGSTPLSSTFLYSKLKYSLVRNIVMVGMGKPLELSVTNRGLKIPFPAEFLVMVDMYKMKVHVYG